MIAEAGAGPLESGEWPFVSVVLPVRNESAFIERSLGSVLEQDYRSSRMEVLVVDGMSDDDTREKVRAMTGGRFPVLLLANPGRIIPTAMNIGIGAAKGSIVLRVDGHATIEPDYVRRAVLALKRTGAHNVGCGVYNEPVNYTARAISAATNSPFGVGGSRYHFQFREQETDCVFMGAFPREVFDHIGPYDEEMACNEDDELSFRLREAGGRVILAPELRSRYYPRSSLVKMARQFFRYGYWKVRVMQLYPGQMRASHFAPGAFVAALVGGLLLGKASRRVRGLWRFMLGAWGTGAAGATALAAGRHGRDLAPLLPVTFFLLHASYGAGFLAGLAAFRKRWKEPSAPVKLLPEETGWAMVERAEREREA